MIRENYEKMIKPSLSLSVTSIRLGPFFIPKRLLEKRIRVNLLEEKPHKVQR